MTRLPQCREQEGQPGDTLSFSDPASYTKDAIADGRGVCRWGRPQHAFLFCPCRGGEQRRYRARPLRRTAYTDLRKFLDTSVSSISGHIAGASYRAGEAGAQATAQSERTKPVLVANRFHAISQASMMSARLRNTELASQWLRR